jgi:hypothetical protein
MKEDNFDIFLSNSLKASEIEINTSIKEAEQMITEKIKVMQVKKRNKQLRLIQVAILVIALFGITGTVLFPQPIYAFKMKFIQSIMNWSKNVHVTISSNVNRPEINEKMEIEVAALQPNIPFIIATPKYIPPDFEFRAVTKSANDEQPTITISFASGNSSILITESRMSGNFSYSMNINTKQGKAERIQVGQYECNLITFINGSCSLTWITDDNIMFRILGNLTPEQAKEMALSMN